MTKEKKNCDVEMRWVCPECGLQNFVTLREMVKKMESKRDMEEGNTLEIPICDDCYIIMELDEEYMSKNYNVYIGKTSMKETAKVLGEF